MKKAAQAISAMSKAATRVTLAWTSILRCRAHHVPASSLVDTDTSAHISTQQEQQIWEQAVYGIEYVT
jgi:hypothetical protein